MQYIAYLDQRSGFPVKEELYEDSTGTFKLFSTDTEELPIRLGRRIHLQYRRVTLTPVNSADAFAK